MDEIIPDKIFDYLSKEKAEYADIRLLKNYDLRLGLRSYSSDVSENSSNQVIVRVLFDKGWGIASADISEDIFEKKLWEVAENALQQARASTSVSIREKKIELAETKVITDYFHHPIKNDLREISCAEMLALLKNLNDIVKKNLKDDFAWSETVIDYSITQSDFSNTEGTNIVEIVPNIDLTIYVVAKRFGYEVASDIIGGIGGFEILQSVNLENWANIVSERVKCMLHAKHAPLEVKTKKIPVIFDQCTASAFIHECVGHQVEADVILESGTILSKKLGCLVADEEVIVIDDPLFQSGYGSYKYDDEGVPANKTTIIERGRLNSLLHTRWTAKEFGHEPKGNAHGISHVSRSLMSNLYLEPVDWSFEEMIEDISLGIYVAGLQRGVAESFAGRFEIIPETAFLIKKKRIVSPIKNIRIRGFMLKALMSIDAIGKDFRLTPSSEKGFCIGNGAPSIRVQNLSIL
ncbi:MAG: TldD/PmbA family protein [Promethearchaeota archaeon]